MFWTIVGAILFVFIGIPLILLALSVLTGLGIFGTSKVVETVVKNRPDEATRKKIHEERVKRREVRHETMHSAVNTAGNVGIFLMAMLFGLMIGGFLLTFFVILLTY